jgi:hypothetical protein
MRLIPDKGERVDLVAGDGLEAVDLLEDVLGEELAARVEDVVLIFEDVGEGRAGGVVPKFSLVSSLHGIIYYSNASKAKHRGILCSPPIRKNNAPSTHE